MTLFVVPVLQATISPIQVLFLAVPAQASAFTAKPVVIRLFALLVRLATQVLIALPVS